MKPHDVTEVETIFAYHEATKHHFHRYARSLGYLDWDTQPNPFRYYDETATIQFPFDETVEPLPYDALFNGERIAPKPLTLETLARFFRYSLGLSAWKEYETSRWSLRVNPSSGNLHPTEAYAFAANVEGMDYPPSVYHYVSEDHRLEIRSHCSTEFYRCLMTDAPQDAFLVCLTSIHWRESWKYGERAFRYCQHDAGHAIAALRFSAALNGWALKLLPEWSTDQVAALAGVNRLHEFHPQEREEAETIALVYPNGCNLLRYPFLDDTAVEMIKETEWFGTANRLSAEQVPWEIIDEAEAATRKPEKTGNTVIDFNFTAPACDSQTRAQRILLQRRSAVDMRPVSKMERETFLNMLYRTLPGKWGPWDAQYWTPSVHLLLFVHRVKGLESGLYMLVRRPDALEPLQRQCRKEFRWEKPETLPSDLPLYLLTAGNLQDYARAYSCHQDIAANGFFSLGMIAEFASTIQSNGAWFYRNLFWETGMIGQVLYLEAEAAGVRSTGIGCFFDDAVHDAMGITDNSYQSLYHFTVGEPVEDYRLTTKKPYPNERFLLEEK